MRTLWACLVQCDAQRAHAAWNGFQRGSELVSHSLAAEPPHRTHLKRATDFSFDWRRGSYGLQGAPCKAFTTPFGEHGASWAWQTPGVFDFAESCGQIATPDR